MGKHGFCFLQSLLGFVRSEALTLGIAVLMPISRRLTKEVSIRLTTAISPTLIYPLKYPYPKLQSFPYVETTCLLFLSDSDNRRRIKGKK